MIEHARIPFSDLIFLDDNPRTRTPEGLQSMADDIRIDWGDIERQEWAWVDPKFYSMKSADAARELWRETLAPLGLRLFKDALTDIKAGKINKTPQDARFSTFEPSLDVKDIFKPDLLMLPPGPVFGKIIFKPL